MASRKVCIRRTGFTLIETLIVIGVLAIIVGFSLIINLGDYQGSAFRAERVTLVTLLHHVYFSTKTT